MLSIAVASACTVEAEQAYIDAVGSILIVKAKRTFFLVYVVRRARLRQGGEGGAEVRTGHV